MLVFKITLFVIGLLLMFFSFILTLFSMNNLDKSNSLPRRLFKIAFICGLIVSLIAIILFAIA